MLQDEAQQQALAEMLANSKLAIAPPEQPAKSGRGDMFLLIGVIGIGLAVFLGIMTARGSKPQTEQPVPSPTPTAPASPQQPAQGSQQALLNPTPAPTPTNQPTQALAQDIARYPVAQVNCPGCAANFRSGPSMTSQIVGSITTGDLVQLTGRVVNQDGVAWTEVGYRGQIGWIASQFLQGGPRNG
jgi:hypothetical protein